MNKFFIFIYNVISCIVNMKTKTMFVKSMIKAADPALSKHANILIENQGINTKCFITFLNINLSLFCEN